MKIEDCRKLFLEKADVPPGFWNKAGVQGGPDCPDDANYASCRGEWFGMSTWNTQAATPGAPWRIVDIRWIFPSAELARSYMQQSLGFLSEGMPPLQPPPSAGQECALFGGNAAGDMMQMLTGKSAQLLTYLSVFRQDLVVAKIYAAEGQEALDLVRSLSEKGGARIKAGLGGLSKPWWKRILP